MWNWNKSVFCVLSWAFVGTSNIIVMDTLRAAVRHLAAPPLDHTGRRLSGRRDRPVCAEPHSGRDHRRFCSGLAADRGGVVCAADGVEVDRKIMR